MGKRYVGSLELTRRGGRVVEVVDGEGRIRPLAPRNDLYNHSPDGFGWGYGGSGPAQLALALAADVLGDDARALRIYQVLKWDLVAGWPQDESWQVTDTGLLSKIYQLELEREESARKT